MPKDSWSSPSGSCSENRLKSNSCTFRVALGSSSGGTCRQGCEMGPAALAPAHSVYPGQTYREAACLFEHGTESPTVHLCLVSSPSLGGNTDAGIGVRCALGLQVFGLPQAHPNLESSGLAQPECVLRGSSSHVPLHLALHPSLTPSINYGASVPAEWDLPPGFQNHTPVRAAVAPTVAAPQSRAPGSPHLVEPGVGGGVVR